MLIEYHRIYNGRDGRETVGCGGGGGGGSQDLTLAGTVRTGRCTAQGCDKNAYFCSESAAGPVGDRRRAATQSANRHLQRPGHPHRTAAAWLAHRQIHEKMPLDAAAPAVRIDLTEDIRRERKIRATRFGRESTPPAPNHRSGSHTRLGTPPSRRLALGGHRSWLDAHDGLVPLRCDVENAVILRTQ